jgi:hypothetical protein
VGGGGDGVKVGVRVSVAVGGTNAVLVGVLVDCAGGGAVVAAGRGFNGRVADAVGEEVSVGVGVGVGWTATRTIAVQ